MSRAMNYEDMPTRTKTSPTRRNGGSSWDENEVRASYRKQPKWKDDRHRMSRERVGDYMQAGA